MEVYAEYGAIGVIVFLFVMMIVNLIKSQKLQDERLQDIRKNQAVQFAKLVQTIENVEGIVIKLIERWNKSDETRDRRHESIISELNDQSDDINFLKGKANGKS
jgi:hypothetical protein|tara:strand:- start:255 stop:566 length:312 start_codon:yes stop_codon:yes gene_type:complete